MVTALFSVQIFQCLPYRSLRCRIQWGVWVRQNSDFSHTEWVWSDSICKPQQDDQNPNLWQSEWLTCKMLLVFKSSWYSIEISYLSSSISTFASFRLSWKYSIYTVYDSPFKSTVFHFLFGTLALMAFTGIGVSHSIICCTLKRWYVAEMGRMSSWLLMVWGLSMED